MAISEAPHVSWNDRKIVFDPTRPRGPQIARIAAQIFGILGGPVFGLIGMLCYPILIPDRLLAAGGLASIVLCFAASFFFIRDKFFPDDAPLSGKLMVRFGIAACATAWAIGFVDIANGYSTPLTTRNVPIAYKRASRDNDPERRSYYVGARLWSSPRDIVEITVPHALFNRLDVPNTDVETSHPAFGAMPNAGQVQLSVGEGRLGIDWLHGVVNAAPL